MTTSPPSSLVGWQDIATACPKCSGNGWRTVRNPDPLLRGVFEVDCEECRGTGRVDVEQPS